MRNADIVRKLQQILSNVVILENGDGDGDGDGVGLAKRTGSSRKGRNQLVKGGDTSRQTN